MTNKQIYDTIEEAINSQTGLMLTVKHGLGETIENTDFQAYILGKDLYEYGFTWGYLTHNWLYYKFMLENITSAKLTTQKYEVRADACYQNALEEEHYNRLEGFDNLFVQAARYK